MPHQRAAGTAFALRARVRVVVLRSSRYLPLALRRLAVQWPHADIAVVAPRRFRDEWDRAARLYEFSARRFSPWTWWRSTARGHVRAWRPDEVVLQLPEPTTQGAVGLGLVALWIAPRGFWLVSPTGDLHFMSAWRWLGDLASRAARVGFVATAIILVAVGSIVAWPAYRLARARAARSGG